MFDLTPTPLQPMLELTVLFPAAFLCFLATKEHLRVKMRGLIWMVVPALALTCLLGGGLCWYMGWRTNRLLLPILIPAAIGFARVTALPAWKPVSVFLGVCGVFSSIGGLSVITDALIAPGNSTPWLSPVGSLADFALGWVLVALCWYPTSRGARGLLNTGEVVRTWYVFWVLPTVFILFNLFLSLQLDKLLYSGQLLGTYALLSLMLTGLLLLFYLMFYLVARELGANTRLKQENQFLHMQTAQYEALRAAIDETRQARHDLRHHFNALSALAERGAWEELRRYLADAKSGIPAAELGLCENPAVDGVAGYYAALSRQSGIPFACRLDLPQALPVSEMDACVVLSNLLENALEASQKAEGRRFIRLTGALRGDRLMLFTVENPYSGELREQDGAIQSTKRKGAGVGLQSVAHIAEKNGGYCRFLYGDGIFTANVMLRGGE